MENQGRKLNSLQAVRAFAFIGVFAAHLGIFNDVHLGAPSVSVFIVLSGFLMTYSYYGRYDSMNISFKNNVLFGIGKIKKLYPLHIIMFLASFVLLIAEFVTNSYDYSVPVLILSVITNIFLVHSWLPIPGVYNSLNGVSWYLSVSMFLYIAFPWILKYIKKNKTKKLVITAFFIFALMIAWEFLVCFLFAHNGRYLIWFSYINPLLRLGDFSIGAIFGYVFLKHGDKIKASVANFAELITFVLIALELWFASNTPTNLVTKALSKPTVLFLPTSVALVFFFAVNKGFISKICTNKALVYLGDVSPYGYLIHQEVIGYINVLLLKVLHLEVNRWIAIVAAVILTWAAMYIYMFLEKKFFNKKKGEVI